MCPSCLQRIFVSHYLLEVKPVSSAKEPYISSAKEPYICKTKEPYIFCFSLSTGSKTCFFRKRAIHIPQKSPTSTFTCSQVSQLITAGIFLISTISCKRALHLLQKPYISCKEAHINIHLLTVDRCRILFCSLQNLLGKKPKSPTQEHYISRKEAHINICVLTVVHCWNFLCCPKFTRNC